MAKAIAKSRQINKAAVKKPVKKAAKAQKGKKKATPKYADKSAGQPELLAVFEAIKKLLLPYDGKGTLKLYGGTGGQISLVSEKAIVVEGRKKDTVWFISALIQKGYLGFYYMPIYMNDPMKKLFSPEFIKCLKGKACFHIKKPEPAIMAEIEKAIQLGYDVYVKRGWV